MAETYIEPTDLLTFYDRNRVLELCKDDTDGTGTPATAAQLQSVGSAPYVIANSAITVAASTLDSHCQRGKRYTRLDLEAIIAAWLDDEADVALAKRAALIRQLVADLAFGYLMSRRGFTGSQMKEMAPRYEEALMTLEAIAAGNMVFDIDANVNAGAPSSVRIGVNVYRPSLHTRLFGSWFAGAVQQNNGNWFGV